MKYPILWMIFLAIIGMFHFRFTQFFILQGFGGVSFGRFPKILSYKNSFGLEKNIVPCIALTRQTTRRNLNDRIHSRPFLSLVEKKWLAFQAFWVSPGRLLWVHDHDFCIEIEKYFDVGNANHIFRMAVLNGKDSVLFKNTSLPMSMSQLHQHSMIYSDRSIPGNFAGDLFGIFGRSRYPYTYTSMKLCCIAFREHILYYDNMYTHSKYVS